MLNEKEIIEKYGNDKVCHNCLFWDEDGYCEKGKGQTLGIQRACDVFLNKNKLK